MKTNILATEIATLERKIEDTKSAVVKKTLRVRLATLKKQFSDGKDSSKTKNDILSKAKVKVEEMTKKDFNEYIKKLSKNDEYKFLGLMSKKEIIDDIKEVAKPVGWRFKGNNNRVPTKKQVILGRKSGDVYYENRSNRSDVSRVVRLEKGGGVGNILEVKDGEDTFYLTYIDPTHFYLSNTRDFKGSAYHSGQFRDRPFYNDVVSWLKSNRPKMAKGGNIDKPLSYYKYDTKRVKMAWNGKIQIGAYYSAEECMEAIKKQANTKEELSHYSIITPDKTIHLGKEYDIKYAKGGEMAKGGGISSADKRVTESKYDDMMGVLPPIMFDTLDGEKVRGFAVDEPSDHKMIDGKMKEVYQGYYEVKEGSKTNYYAIGEYVYFDDKGKALRYDKGSASVSDEPSMAEIIEEIVDEKSIPESVVEQMIQEYGLDENNVKDWFDEHYEGEYNSDEDLAYGYVDMIGGLDALGKQTLETYFDYSAFGRDLAINDFHEHEGHYFRYKNGGMMAKGGGVGKYAEGGSLRFIGMNSEMSEYELENLQGKGANRGVSIKEMNKILSERFPYSFGFTLRDAKSRDDLYFLKPNQDNPLRGIQDDSIKISFDSQHTMDFRIFQGGENTYFYFLLFGSDDKQYIGEFGFKDRGDVPKEYVTSFISFLCTMYGYPFKVSHNVYAKGGGIYSSDDRWVVTFQNQDSAEFEKVTVRANNKKSAIAIAEDESGLGSDWSYYSAEKQMANGGGFGDEKPMVGTYDGKDAIKGNISKIGFFKADNGTHIEMVGKKDGSSPSGMIFYVTINGRGLYAKEYREDAYKLYRDEIEKYNTKYAHGGSMGSNNKNGKYLDSISSDKKSKILKNIASHYGFSVGDAEEEVRDEDAEMLYEYIANDQSLRMEVYNGMERGKMAMGGNLGEPHRTNIK